MTEEPLALIRQASELARQQRPAEAIAAYRDILMRWPKYADAWYNLAVLQRHSFQLPEALESYQKALDNGIARPEEVHLNRSVIFTNYLHDHASAANELQLALALNPGYAPALLNLATLHEDLGQRQQASDLYLKIPHDDPSAAEALARFANLQPLAEVKESLIERLGSAVATASNMPDRASLGFALGRLLDGAGRYREAFAAYEAANRASLAAAGVHVTPYDAKRQAAFVDLLIHEGRPRARATRRAGAPRPIFICGMFRSGSTLVEQLLAATPGVAAGGEIDFIPHFINRELVPFQQAVQALSSEKLDEVATRYLADLTRAFPAADYVTDKRPDNFLFLGLIKSLFPDAKIIHTTRDPLDNCLSIYFLHLEQQMSYALDLKHIADYYRQYRRLMSHWQAEFGGDIFDVSYDRLVREPKATLAEAHDFLGLPDSGEVAPVALRSTVIKTASSWQVREPLYTSSSGRARHYAPQLDALRRDLADFL